MRRVFWLHERAAAGASHVKLTSCSSLGRCRRGSFSSLPSRGLSCGFVGSVALSPAITHTRYYGLTFAPLSGPPTLTVVFVTSCFRPVHVHPPAPGAGPHERVQAARGHADAGGQLRRRLHHWEGRSDHPQDLDGERV